MTDQLYRAYYSPSAARLFGFFICRGSDGSEIEVTCVEPALEDTGSYGWPDAVVVGPVTERIRKGQAGDRPPQALPGTITHRPRNSQ